MGKRITAAILILIMICILGVTVAFANGQDTIKIEQVCAVLPDVNVYFYIYDGQGNPITDYKIDVGQVNEALGEENLKINSVIPGSRTDKGTRYIFLLDISKSIPRDVFNKTKQQLIDFTGKMSVKDSMVLITFGETMEVKLQGTESSDEITQVIQSIERNANKTRFFDAIDKACSLASIESEALPGRRVIIAITDGHDVYQGGSTKKSASDELIATNLPLYALVVEGNKKEYTESLENFSLGSNGKYYLMDGSNVADAFSQLETYLNSYYVVSASAKTNITDGTIKELMLQIQQDEYKMTYTAPVVPKSSPDNIKPTFSVNVSGNNVISVIFSENVSGADKASDYGVIASDGVKLAISDVSYNESEYTATVTLDKVVYDGNYTLKLSNIYDVSMEKNLPSDNSMQFTVTGHGNEVIESSELPEEVSFIEQYWWVFGIVLAAIIVLVLIIVLREKKKRKLQEMPDTPDEGADIGLKHHVKSHEGRKIKLIISDANGLERVLDVFVKSRLTLGRSDTCDIYFDDPELSRKHAEISLRDGELFIEDLSSTNGTVVNGVRVSEGRKINSGDAIEMGQVKVIVSF